MHWINGGSDVNLTHGPLKKKVFIVRIVFLPPFLASIVDLVIHFYHFIMNFDCVATNLSQSFIQVLM